MSAWQIEPMRRWPYPETEVRRANPFRAKFDDTLTRLEAELGYLDVTGTVAVRVVAAEADVRRDGMLRARANVRHPGVALSFESRFGPLTYPCDTFTGRWYGDVDWQINLRAIALGLEALRKLDRYGIAGRGEQYTGWRAIESGKPAGFATADEAIRWLREITGITGPEVSPDQLLRKAVAIVHPDRNDGDRTTWDRLDQAKQLLDAGGRR